MKYLPSTGIGTSDTRDSTVVPSLSSLVAITVRLGSYISTTGSSGEVPKAAERTSNAAPAPPDGGDDNDSVSTSTVTVASVVRSMANQSSSVAG